MQRIRPSNNALRISVPVAGMFRHANDSAPRETEAIFGEDLVLLNDAEAVSTTTPPRFLAVATRTTPAEPEGYHGFMHSSDVIFLHDSPPDTLNSHDPRPNQRTYRLTGNSFVYTEPDIKSPLLWRLGIGSVVRVLPSDPQVIEAQGHGSERGSVLASNFVALDLGRGQTGYLFAHHLSQESLDRTTNRELTCSSSDPQNRKCLHDSSANEVLVWIRRFLGVPYLWGGRSAFGIDCSGLVQLALACVGMGVPRDANPQAAWFAAFARDHAPATEDLVENQAALEAGSLIYWKGHVAIATEKGSWIHADGHLMRVVEGDPKEITDGIKERTGLEITHRVPFDIVRRACVTEIV